MLRSLELVAALVVGFVGRGVGGPAPPPPGPDLGRPRARGCSWAASRVAAHRRLADAPAGVHRGCRAPPSSRPSSTSRTGLPADDRAAVRPRPRERCARGDELRRGVRRLRRRRLPRQPADRPDRHPHRRGLVRRLRRAAGHDPQAGAAAPAGCGTGPRPGRDPRGAAPRRPRPGAPRPRRRDDGPRGDVGQSSGRPGCCSSIEELRLDPAVIGVVAALGGFGSLLGALLAARATARFGIGNVVIASMLFAAFGNLLIPLAPAGLPLVAIACLVGQQLIGDTAVTVFDVTEISVRQARVGDRQLGRVNATVRVAMVLAQLAATLAGGLVAELIGLRGAAFLAPIGALLGAWALWASPVRSLRRIEASPAVTPADPSRTGPPRRPRGRTAAGPRPSPPPRRTGPGRPAPSRSRTRCRPWRSSPAW